MIKEDDNKLTIGLFWTFARQTGTTTGPCSTSLGSAYPAVTNCLSQLA
jgi:hypothetical protein